MDEETVFLKALEIDDPQKRATFLDEACAGDAALREAVEALLASHQSADDFLEKPCLAGTISDSEPSMDEMPLDFLAPSGRDDSLGRLGSYEILEVLGRGGMGVVLKALDTRLSRVVAIKVLAPAIASNAMARRRFLREARAAAAVAHPHVVTIFAVDGEDQTPYLVMECVDGKTLKQKIENQGALDLTEILRIGSQIAQGLAAAHAQGLVHRDVKPGNILLENGIERVKLTDFGLARTVDDMSVTRTGEITGTPEFMSPEQAQGARVDHRTDLFSLGSVIYVMCTGRSPFRADSTIAAIRRVCDGTPRPIREVNPDIPAWLAEIVDRLLAKDPDQRFQSADEVAQLLSRQLAILQSRHDTQAEAQAMGVRYEQPAAGVAAATGRRAATMFVGRSKWWWAVGVAIVLLVLLCLTEATGVTHWLVGPRGQGGGRIPSGGGIAMEPGQATGNTEGIHVVTSRGPLGDADVDVLHEEDSVRVTARAPKPSYLYVVLLGADGSIRPLYPWIDGDWQRRTAEEKRTEVSVSIPSLSGQGDPAACCTLLMLARDDPLGADMDGRSLFDHLSMTSGGEGLAGAWYLNGKLQEIAGGRQPRRAVTPETLAPRFAELLLIENELQQLSPTFPWTAALVFNVAPAGAMPGGRMGVPGGPGPGPGWRPLPQGGGAGPPRRDPRGLPGRELPGGGPPRPPVGRPAPEPSGPAEPPAPIGLDGQDR